MARCEDQGSWKLLVGSSSQSESMLTGGADATYLPLATSFSMIERCAYVQLQPKTYFHCSALGEQEAHCLHVDRRTPCFRAGNRVVCRAGTDVHVCQCVRSMSITKNLVHFEREAGYKYTRLCFKHWHQSNSMLKQRRMGIQWSWPWHDRHAPVSKAMSISSRQSLRPTVSGQTDNCHGRIAS